MCLEESGPDPNGAPTPSPSLEGAGSPLSGRLEKIELLSDRWRHISPLRTGTTGGAEAL